MRPFRLVYNIKTLPKGTSDYPSLEKLPCWKH